MHVMNAYVYNLCIHTDDTKRPIENAPPPITLPYPKIYPIVVTKIISHANTYHLIIVFVGVIHAYEYQFLTLTVSTPNHSFSFKIHFKYSEIILM